MLSKCNSGNELVAHHLNGWNWYKEGRFLLENGVILCKNVTNFSLNFWVVEITQFYNITNGIMKTNK